MNRGEPSDDPSKIRGRSSVVVTLLLFHGTDFYMYRMLIRESKLLGLEAGGVAPRNPFFLVHSKGVRTHLRGLQVTVTRMAGK
jgi:hypothetical protein